MPSEKRCGGRGLRLLLSSTSVVALLIGAGTPTAFAASCVHTISSSFDNPGGHTTANVCVRNTSFAGAITNEGTISPSGIALVNGTISGTIQSSGIIKGGISLDAPSKISAGTSVAIAIVGPTFQGGIANGGTIQSSGNAGIGVVGVASFQGGIGNGNLISGANGIEVSDGSTFLGGITNSGTIAGVNAGIVIGGFTHGGVALTQTSFGGGITNTGAISGQGGVGVVNVTQFTDSITNSGTIQNGSFGILVSNVSFFGSSSAGGGITNSGKIAGSTSAIKVTGVATFAGSVVNSAGGTISAAGTAIGIGHTASIGTFTGNISNAGTISAGNEGIFEEVTAATGTFLGGISNSGMISAGLNGPNSVGSGILAAGGATFAGGIGNSGTISALQNGITVDEPLAFSGGITNSGKISSTLGSGIYILEISTFTGGVTNSGTISANNNGIELAVVLSFSGNIANSGTIAAKTGIHIASLGTVVGSTVNGSIVDSGTIVATAHGILIDAVSTIVSTGTAIALSGPTFTGGISNAGTISANYQAISVAGVSTFLGGIANSGRITGHSGIALSGVSQFGNSAGGGISNSGTISVGSGTAISAKGISTFQGGIANSGTISAAGIGIGIGNSGAAAAVSIFAGGISNSGTIVSGYAGILLENVATFTDGISNSGFISATAVKDGIDLEGVTNFSGGVSNSGTISAINFGILIDSTSTFTGGISNSGIIAAGNDGIRFSGVGQFGNSAGGGITNSGTISAGNNAIEFNNVSTFLGGISNSGTITAGGGGVLLGAVSTFSGNISNSGQITGSTGIVINAGVGFATGGAIVNSGTISGTGGAAIDASGATSPVTIQQNDGIIGGNVLLSPNADVMTIAGGTVAGDIVGQGTSDTLNFTLGAGNTFTYGNPYDFTGINAVNVNSGTAVINGAANSATTLTVSNGGTLAGIGTIATAMTVNSGGKFAPGSGTPGSSMKITGSLAFISGALYIVQVNPSTASFANVNGTASLAGNVSATFAAGSYVISHYTILATTGGIGGTKFAALGTTNLPAGFIANLSYTTDDVLLNLIPIINSGGLNNNQLNVLNAINNFFNNGGTLPPNFASILGLNGPALANALSQLDGESATGAEKGASQMMTEFLDLMLDPWTGGGAGSGGGGTTGFAAESDGGLPPDVALAYARALKKQQPSPQTPQNFEQRWSAWGSGFGGSSTTEGNATVGSSNVTASTYGYAAGMDYHATRDTIYGFALAGGGTNWSLAQNLGTGRSDAFQGGVHATTHFGPAYVSGALAFANHWFETNRIAALGDQLRANFEGQSYAARAEAGYRYAVLPLVGVTPYAALQVQDFHTPSYSETDLTGGGFGLNYTAVNATDTRSELGARFDDLTMLGTMPLVLRGRLAWAHDWVSNPSLGAVFQTLPGANFTVNGAAVPHDSALTTAAAELHLNSNWTALAKFDGEFASGSQTYAGTGTLRYSW